MKRILRLFTADEGATAVEYAVMLALILLACLAGIAVVGVRTAELWSDNETGLQKAFKD